MRRRILILLALTTAVISFAMLAIASAGWGSTSTSLEQLTATETGAFTCTGLETRRGAPAVLVHNSCGPNRFPGQSEPNSQMVRSDPTTGGVTHYIEYGADGRPVVRVDMTGGHGPIEGPHAHYYGRGTNPLTGETYVTKGDVVSLTEQELGFFG